MQVRLLPFLTCCVDCSAFTVIKGIFEGDCEDLCPFFILTALTGIYYVFLWFFWVLVFWWRKISRRLISFSLVVILWFILCLVSVALASALVTEIVDHHEKIFNKTKDEHFEYLGVASLGSIVLLWTVHLSVFVVNVCYNLCKRSKT